VGITNDLSRRLELHNSGQAAAWTRNRRPVRYVYTEKHAGKPEARKREIEIKGWRREKKEALFKAGQNKGESKKNDYAG